MPGRFDISVTATAIGETGVVKGGLCPTGNDVTAGTLTGVMFGRGVEAMARLAIIIPAMIEDVFCPESWCVAL